MLRLQLMANTRFAQDKQTCVEENRVSGEAYYDRELVYALDVC